MCNFSTRTYQPKDAPEWLQQPWTFPFLAPPDDWDLGSISPVHGSGGGGGCHGTEDLVLTVHTQYT